MHSSNLRNLFHLYWTKVILVFVTVLLFAPAEAVAQGAVTKHQEFYDDKPIHYGFFFAVPFTRFSVKHNAEFVTADSILTIHSPNRANIRMGFSINANLNEDFDIRTTPTLSLYTREVFYDYANGRDKLKRESTWIELPLMLKYKSKRRHNTRMYMVAGLSYGMETNVKQKRVQGYEQLHTKRSDLSLEYGFGLEKFMEFAKFTPELRFSHGLVNMLSSSATHVGIDRLKTHTVTLYLFFE